MKSMSVAKLLSGFSLVLMTISTAHSASAAQLSAISAGRAATAIVLVRDGGHSGGGGHRGGAMGFHGGMGGHLGRPSAIVHGPSISHPRVGFSFAPRHAYHPRMRWHGYVSSNFWTPPYPSYRSRFAYNNDACLGLKQKARRTGSAYWWKRYDACRS